jgi:VWFA-related protein
VSDRPPARLALILLLFAAVAPCAAQQPAAPEEQEPVKVYTEEVRLPVVAYDERERFDPTLGTDDVLVLEDGVPQRVRSVRRVPANVLLVFDMGGQVTATRAADATADAALRILDGLREGDRVAFVNNSGRAEVLQDWTEDRAAARQVLRTRLLCGNCARASVFSAKRSRLSECLALAGAKLKERPVGNTHVVVFTDGLEAQSREEIRADEIAKDAVRSLLASQASVHVFCFASMVENAVKYRNSPVSVGGTGNAVRVVIDVDFEMRRWFKNYALATKRREAQLAELAREAGGRVLLPATTEEVLELASKVSRDVGAQYVVTYTPLKPFRREGEGERRRADVSARRMGLQLFTLRSVVTAPQRATHEQ